jgi:hypothetical protein
VAVFQTLVAVAVALDKQEKTPQSPLMSAQVETAYQAT